MEVSPSAKATPSGASLWAGRIISGICILFLLFDAIGKIVKEAHSVSGTTALGIPAHDIQGIGALLLVCTVIYLIPRTAILGAVLLTGYLGGATAVMLRAELPIYFSLAFCILVWLGLYLRDEKTRRLFSPDK